MNLFILAPLFIALAACGGGTTENNNSSAGPDAGSVVGLSCNAVSYCSTWKATETAVTAPTERGGTIADGIYRLERGSSSVKLLQFAGNHVNEIGDSFDNETGTYSTANGTITFSFTARCDRSGSTDNVYAWKDRPYYVASADTLLIGMADSNTGVVWYEYKRLPPEQICMSNANVKCRTTNCSCSVVTNGFGTVTDGVKSCSSSAH